MNVKKLEVGCEFVAKKAYPFYDDEPISSNEERICDITDGERAEILEYNNEDNTYKLLNLSLETPDAWFIISESDLLKLQ